MKNIILAVFVLISSLTLASCACDGGCGTTYAAPDYSSSSCCGSSESCCGSGNW